MIGAMAVLIPSQFFTRTEWEIMVASVGGFAVILLGEAITVAGNITQLRAAATDQLAVARRFVNYSVIWVLFGLLAFVPDPEWASVGWTAAFAVVYSVPRVIALAWKSVKVDGTGTWAVGVGIVLAVLGVILLAGALSS